jgi:hypothetical protein
VAWRVVSSLFFSFSFSFFAKRGLPDSCVRVCVGVLGKDCKMEQVRFFTPPPFVALVPHARLVPSSPPFSPSPQADKVGFLCTEQFNWTQLWFVIRGKCIFQYYDPQVRTTFAIRGFEFVFSKKKKHTLLLS